MQQHRFSGGFLVFLELYETHCIGYTCVTPQNTVAVSRAAYCRIQTFLMDLSPGFYEALPSADLKTTHQGCKTTKITQKKFFIQPFKMRIQVDTLCLHWKYRISFYCFWSMKTSHFEHLPLFQFSVGEEGNGLQLFSEVLLLVAIGAVTTTQYLDTYVQNLWLPIRRLSALFHSFSSFFLFLPSFSVLWDKKTKNISENNFEFLLNHKSS